MLAFLLNFILIIVFVAFVIVCVTAYRIYRSFHNIKRKFTAGNGQRQTKQQYQYEGS